MFANAVERLVTMAGNRRRKRIPDRYKVGRSSLVPFIESEGWQDRHRRRKEEALKHEPDIRTWCNLHRWRFRIANNGHHWIFTTHENKMIEWFPSSGKFGIGKQWDSTVHIHDYLQLIEVLEMTL